jgi:hypothetical protein
MAHSELESAPKAADAVGEAINGRGKRGQKCKSAAVEAKEPEPEPEPETTQAIKEPKPRAPVARMY